MAGGRRSLDRPESSKSSRRVVLFFYMIKPQEWGDSFREKMDCFGMTRRKHSNLDASAFEKKGFFDPLGFCSGDVTEGKIRFYREVRSLVSNSEGLYAIG